jgi:hypothetical protein
MNERIRKLVKQSGPDPVGYIGNWGRVQWADNVYPQLGDQMYAAVDLEEFAKLIVKECAGLFPNVYVSLETEWGHTSVIAEDYIKNHFGVEE